MTITREKLAGCFKSSWLTIATMCGVIGGVIFGLALRSREDKWSDREVMYVAYIGELFLRSLKALILPLIVPSLITAVGSLDMSLSGRVGGRAIAYYMGTTILAVIMGIFLVTTIHPGVKGQERADNKIMSRNVTTADTLMDLIRQMVPPNLIQATMQGYRTSLKYPGNMAFNDTKGQLRDPEEILTWKHYGEWVNGTNILGLVTFAIILGIALAKMGPRGKPLLDFFTCLAEAMMVITTWIINLAPIGVFFLIAGQVLGVKDFMTILNQLGWYFTTVMLGLIMHGFIVLPLIYSICTRSLPFRFIANMTNAFTTAFGTGSSSATLPVTIGLLEEKNNIDPRICRFVLPIGATINMDGTALYEAVAAIFIAQINGMDMTLVKIIAISITATAASIGAAGIPQAGLVTMVMVLETVGLPPGDVTIILAVDWLLDRFRTAINVLGDSIGAGIVFHLSKNELETMGTTVKQPKMQDGFEAVPMTDVIHEDNNENNCK